jgi:hypothetical protein
VALSPCLGPNIREVGYHKSGVPIIWEVATMMVSELRVSTSDTVVVRG